jgi:hypothetical protein
MTRPTIPGLIFIKPLVKVKPVESYPLRTNSNFRDKWANLDIETILVHAQIGGGITQAD